MKYMMTLPAVAMIAACADWGANYQPILDGTPSRAYHTDLSECRSLARDQKQLRKHTIETTVLGAGAGAALGELDDDGDALGGAVAGALAGGAAGAVKAREQRKTIVLNCLRGRGHRVAA
ncbi:glycine zipper family protein [Rhodobacteraceae bacterium D3-12]|nr:glycine zipper family protein [Rhodobacteraceae bacterium D3-12]